jgi:hypothetical protein
MIIIATELIFLCLCPFIPSIVVRQRLGKDVPAAPKTAVEDLWDSVRILSEVSPRDLPVYTSHYHRHVNNTRDVLAATKTVIGFVFFAVCVVSKECRRLLVPELLFIIY